MTATAVERALELTTTVKPREKAAIEHELGKVNKEKGNLLHVEQEARQALDAHATALRDELTVLTTFGRAEPLPMLSQEVLTWRHGHWLRGIPVPQLALISLMATPQPSMQFHCNEYKVRKLSSSAHFSYLYRDVMERMGGSDRTREESLTWHFKGVIPASTKVKIRQARSQFTDIYLLAEAPLHTWTHKRNQESRVARARRRIAEMNLDPIVLGYAANRLWVIDVFDPTPTETYILNEFTTKALPPA